METLFVICGTMSSSSIVIFLGFVLFFYFAYKIYNSEKDMLRYSLFMAIVGIICIILSFGNQEHSEAAKELRNVLLICGLIFTGYGSFVSINKLLKEKKD